MKPTKQKKLTPESIVEILKENGSLITIKEAEYILEFIDIIAHIAVIQYLSKRF